MESSEESQAKTAKMSFVTVASRSNEEEVTNSDLKKTMTVLIDRMENMLSVWMSDLETNIIYLNIFEYATHRGWKRKGKS